MYDEGLLIWLFCVQTPCLLGLLVWPLGLIDNQYFFLILDLSHACLLQLLNHVINSIQYLIYSIQSN